jgi:hypothetical protein
LKIETCPKLVGYQRFEKCLDFRVFPAEGRAMGAEGPYGTFFFNFFHHHFFHAARVWHTCVGHVRAPSPLSVRSSQGRHTLKKMALMLGRMDKNRYF